MEAKLFSKDWKSILDIIYRINNKANIFEFQYEVLECLRYIMPFSQGIFHVYSIRESKYTLRDRPVVYGTEALFLDEFAEHYVNDDYFMRIGAASQDDTFRDTDVFPDELRVQTEWYREIYARQGIHYALRSILTHNGALVGSIDLFKAKEEGDFSDRDVEVLKNLSRHVALKLATLAADEKPRELTADISSKLAASFGFTPREIDVIICLQTAGSRADVAQKLCISQSTLKKHVNNIYRKMGVCNRAQLHAALHALGVW